MKPIGLRAGIESRKQLNLQFIELSATHDSIHRETSTERCTIDGYPSTTHLGWARHSLDSACPLVIGQLVDKSSLSTHDVPTQKGTAAWAEEAILQPQHGPMLISNTLVESPPVYRNSQPVFARFSGPEIREWAGQERYPRIRFLQLRRSDDKTILVLATKHFAIQIFGSQPGFALADEWSTFTDGATRNKPDPNRLSRFGTSNFEVC